MTFGIQVLLYKCSYVNLECFCLSGNRFTVAMCLSFRTNSHYEPLVLHRYGIHVVSFLFDDDNNDDL